LRKEGELLPLFFYKIKGVIDVNSKKVKKLGKYLAGNLISVSEKLEESVWRWFKVAERFQY